QPGLASEWGEQSCRNEPLTCGIRCYLQVDSIRIELKGRKPSWCLRTAYWCREKSHILEVKIFAPNAKQMHIVNHLKGSPTEEKRNVLEETARSTRGDIQDLANLNFSELDAVIIPAVVMDLYAMVGQ
uniref:Uncharacterized protein n=1 Tax=Equus caballus TaxID=9796 RepID=A0A9L0TKT2_HORSE